MEFNGLLERNNAKIVGLPKRFNFPKAVKSAHRIYILMAFARASGWKHLRKHLLDSSADIVCVAGRNFGQTEPSILRDWLSSDFRSRLTPYVYDQSLTFHPKVIFVGFEEKSFAIIGSGNLTEGGLTSNIECGYFVGSSNIPVLRELDDWIQQIIESTGCEHLTPDVLSEYEELYRKAAKERKTISNIEQQSSKKFEGNVSFDLPNPKRCIARLIRVKKSRDYQKAKRSGRPLALAYLRQIYKELRLSQKSDTYQITKKNWRCMYGQVPLGTVREGEAAKAARNLQKLRRGIRLLKDPAISAPERLGRIVDGHESVHGIGKGIASKILLSLDSLYNPIMNGAVLRVFEDHFGGRFIGRITRNASVPRLGHEYRAFRETMIDLRQKAGFEDMIELDRALWLMK